MTDRYAPIPSPRVPADLLLSDSMRTQLRATAHDHLKALVAEWRS